MGLKTSTGQAKWINLSRGLFILREQGGVETEYPALEATLIGLGFRDTEYENKKKREVVCTWRDGNDLYRLSMDSESGYGRQFLLKLMNADLAQPLELTPTFDETAGKKQSGMFVAQHGTQLKQKFNKDTLPPPKTAVFGGKTHYDFSEQRTFIEDYITKNVIPLLAANASRPQSHDRTSQGDAHIDENQDFNPEDGSGIPDDDTNTPF